MNLDQLRSFLEIAEVSSFHKAADRLGTTQPTISSRIKTLEQQLGCQLFYRAKNGVQLTDAGNRYRKYAEIAVTAMERGRNVTRLPKGFDRSISIGLQSYLLHDLGARLVQEISNALGDLAIRIDPDYSEAIISHVSHGIHDLGVVYVPKMVSELEVKLIGKQEVVLVASPEIESGSTEFLNSYVQVFWGQDFLQIQSEALGAETAPSISVGSPRLAFDILLSRGGSAYIDRRMAEPAVSMGALIFVPGFPVFQRAVYLVSQPRRMVGDNAVVAEIIGRWFQE